MIFFLVESNSWKNYWASLLTTFPLPQIKRLHLIAKMAYNWPYTELHEKYEWQCLITLSIMIFNQDASELVRYFEVVVGVTSFLLFFGLNLDPIKRKGTPKPCKSWALKRDWNLVKQEKRCTELRHHLGSISSTFYVQLLCSWIPKARKKILMT